MFNIMLRSLNKKPYTFVVWKEDKAVQTDHCLSLEIGDKILAESHSPKNSASPTTWWHAILKWY